MTLSDATIPGQSGPGSNGNEGVLCIPPKPHHHWNLTIRLFSVISKTLVGWGCHLSAGVQSVYSTTPADKASWFNEKISIVVIYKTCGIFSANRSD